MKKVCLALLLLFLCVMLGGCLLEPAENLYAPPKQSVDYYNLLSAIESAMPQGASYSAPVRGENQLAVQRVNLDDDPEDEAVAFWKTDGEKPLTIAVFDNKNGSFELMASLELAGSAFTQVQYVQIDGEAGNEIVFGRQISDQLPQLLCVYTMRDGALCELLNTGYETYMTADLNADGLQDIFLLNADGNATNGVASLEGRRADPQSGAKAHHAGRLGQARDLWRALRRRSGGLRRLTVRRRQHGDGYFHPARRGVCQPLRGRQH